jgi:hypothetical protein
LNAESASLKSQVNQLAESSEKTEDGKCCIEGSFSHNSSSVCGTNDTLIIFSNYL